MKKSKLSLCLASSFVAALSLVACNSVSSKDGAVVTIKNHDGSETVILTDAAYSEYMKSTDGVSKFYNAILEALVRYEYSNSGSYIRSNQGNWPKSIKDPESIKAEAENNVQNDKNTAEQNAKSNDTSYEDEWDSILKSHNCEDEDDLLEYYIYQLEKEDISDKFLIQQRDSSLTSEWLGVNNDGTDPNVGNKAKGVFPYHIRHVLTSISGGESDYATGTITSQEAKNLGNTMKAFLNKDYSFGRVATEYSGDEGSAAKSGDVGIMTTTTSFVNEFKLGIYAFDNIYNTINEGTTEAEQKTHAMIEKGVGLDNNYKVTLSRDVKDQGLKTAWGTINEGEIQKVPFGAFIEIGKAAEFEKDDNGAQVNKGDEHYFPRNVLYNYYLNFHNPFVITKQVLDVNGFPTGYDGSDPSIDASRFKNVTLNGVPTEVLVDKDQNVIIGCRSSHGIHFMIMERSIYDYKDNRGEGENFSKLTDYYTSLTPSDANFPTGKATYVASISTSEQSDYTTRANEIKSAVQSYDETYDYRLFEYILDVEKDKININPKLGIEENIRNYIAATRANNNDNAYKSLNEAWRTYTEQVANQYFQRTVDGFSNWQAWFDDPSHNTGNPDIDYKTEYKFRMISPRCAVGFKTKGNSNVEEWAEGGYCYHAE